MFCTCQVPKVVETPCKFNTTNCPTSVFYYKQYNNRAVFGGQVQGFCFYGNQIMLLNGSDKSSNIKSTIYNRDERAAQYDDDPIFHITHFFL